MKAERNLVNGGCRRVSLRTTQTGGSNRQESSLTATHQDGSNRQESSLTATHQDGSNRQETSLRATHTGGSNRQCNDGSNRHKNNRTGGWSKTLKLLILAALIQVSWGMQSGKPPLTNDTDAKAQGPPAMPPKGPQNELAFFRAREDYRKTLDKKLRPLTSQNISNGKVIYGNMDVYTMLKNAYTPFVVEAGGIVASTGGMSYLFDGMRIGSEHKVRYMDHFPDGVTDSTTKRPTFKTTIQEMIENLKKVTLITLTVKDPTSGKKIKHTWVHEKFKLTKDVVKGLQPKDTSTELVHYGRLAEFKQEIREWFEGWCTKENRNNVFFENIREAEDAHGKPIKMSWTPGKMKELQREAGRDCVLMFDNGGMTFKVTKMDGTQIISGDYVSDLKTGKVKKVKSVDEEGNTNAKGKMSKREDITTMKDVLTFVEQQLAVIAKNADTEYTMKNVAVGYTGTWRTDDSLTEQKAFYSRAFTASGVSRDWIMDVSNADEAKYMGLLMDGFIEGLCPSRFTRKQKVLLESSSSSTQFLIIDGEKTFALEADLSKQQALTKHQADENVRLLSKQQELTNKLQADEAQKQIECITTGFEKSMDYSSHLNHLKFGDYVYWPSEKSIGRVRYMNIEGASQVTRRKFLTKGTEKYGIKFCLKYEDGKWVNISKNKKNIEGKNLKPRFVKIEIPNNPVATLKLLKQIVKLSIDPKICKNLYNVNELLRLQTWAKTDDQEMTAEDLFNALEGIEQPEEEKTQEEEEQKVQTAECFGEEKEWTTKKLAKYVLNQSWSGKDNHAYGIVADRMDGTKLQEFVLKSNDAEVKQAFKNHPKTLARKVLGTNNSGVADARAKYFTSVAIFKKGDKVQYKKKKDEDWQNGVIETVNATKMTYTVTKDVPNIWLEHGKLVKNLTSAMVQERPQVAILNRRRRLASRRRRLENRPIHRLLREIRRAQA